MAQDCPSVRLYMMHSNNNNNNNNNIYTTMVTATVYDYVLGAVYIGLVSNPAPLLHIIH